jgi:tetratricopeptide (TPR) repeat protein
VPPDDRDPLSAIGDKFEIALLEERTRDQPLDLEALHHLADAYSARGRWQEALAADLRLVALEPDRAEYRYDLACSLARVGRADEAFAALARAVDLGFRCRDLLVADPDLETLRADPRWAALVRRAPPGTGSVEDEDEDDDSE